MPKRRVLQIGISPSKLRQERNKNIGVPRQRSAEAGQLLLVGRPYATKPASSQLTPPSDLTAM